VREARSLDTTAKSRSRAASSPARQSVSQLVICDESMLVTAFPEMIPICSQVRYKEQATDL
jgi:hypothetical protein